MLFPISQQRWPALAALSMILLIGALLRLHDVERRTLNHPEVYTPGIDLPWNLSNPNPRFSLWQTLAGTIAGEPHPPGYYVFMLGWTKWFGSSILSLRLPSLLFGVASIFLIYVLAVHTEDTLTGLLAAAMLAGNGLHVYWSQTARMYSMGCFLALLSTVFLVLLMKRGSRRPLFYALHFIFTLVGLATHVYFWLVFITQATWVFFQSLRRSSSPPDLLQLQIVIGIVATPLLAIAAFQSGAASRPSTLGLLEGVMIFLEFGSLFEVDALSLSTVSVNAVAVILSLLATVFLFSSLVLRKRENLAADCRPSGDAQEYRSPHRVATVAVAVLAVLSILLFGYAAKTLLPGRSIRLVIAASVLPVALLLIDVLLSKYWERMKNLLTGSARIGQWPESYRSLNIFLVVMPLTLIAGISMFNPILIQRGTLLFVPYLLIVLSAGLVSLIYLDQRWISLVLFLAIIHGSSVLHFKAKHSNPDYKGLAERWVSKIEDSDIIVVHGRGHPFDWKVAPIFYYLNADRYHYIGDDFGKKISSHPRSRVWVLSFPSIPTEKEVTDALADYHIQERIDALNISARLYVPEASIINSLSPNETTQFSK